jgi:hypothetical protein
VLFLANGQGNLKPYFKDLESYTLPRVSQIDIHKAYNRLRAALGYKRALQITLRSRAGGLSVRSDQGYKHRNDIPVL